MPAAGAGERLVIGVSDTCRQVDRGRGYRARASGRIGSCCERLWRTPDTGRVSCW